MVVVWPPLSSEHESIVLSPIRNPVQTIWCGLLGPVGVPGNDIGHHRCLNNARHLAILVHAVRVRKQLAHVPLVHYLAVSCTEGNDLILVPDIGVD